MHWISPRRITAVKRQVMPELLKFENFSEPRNLDWISGRGSFWSFIALYLMFGIVVFFCFLFIFTLLNFIAFLNHWRAMKSRHWMSLGAQSLNGWLVLLESEALEGRGEGRGAVAWNFYTMSSGDVKELVGGGWSGRSSACKYDWK